MISLLVEFESALYPSAKYAANASEASSGFSSISSISSTMAFRNLSFLSCSISASIDCWNEKVIKINS